MSDNPDVLGESRFGAKARDLETPDDAGGAAGGEGAAQDEGGDPTATAVLDPATGLPPQNPLEPPPAEGIPPGMEGIAAAADDLLMDDPVVIDPESLLLQEEGEILKIAMSRMFRACSFRVNFEARWTTSWNDWMMFLTGDAKVWQSRMFVPLVYEQVSSALPNFVAAIFDSGKLFDIKGRDQASQKQASAVQDTVEHKLRVESSAEDEAEDWVKYALIFGTGVLKSSWIRREGVQRTEEDVRVPMSSDPANPQVKSIGKRTKNTYGVVLENRPELEAVDLWNWFPAPYMTGNGRIPWAFERVESTLEDMVRDAAAGLFGKDGPQRMAEWLKTRPENQSQNSTTWAAANTRASSWSATGIGSPYSSDFQTDESGDRKHAQIVYWLMWANDYRIVISGDGSKILGMMPNPHSHGQIPYVTYCFERIPKSPFGRGVGDVLAQIQKQINFNYNKGNDAAQLALNKPMKLRGAGNAGITVVWQPGTIVRLRDPGDLEPLDIKNPMSEVSAMNAELAAHADKATGLNDLSRGEAPAGANTATEFSGIQSQFRMRMNGHARRLRNAMSRLGRMVVSDIQQFIDAPTAIEVIGEDGLDWKTVEPAELVGNFNVFSTANFSKSNPGLVRQDLLAAAPIVLPDPMVDHRAFLIEFFKGFGFEHPERFVIKPPPPMRNPQLEQKALDMGIDVDPSPEEVMTGAVDAHLQVHLAALQAYQAGDPGANSAGASATLKHVEKTMQLGVMMQEQGQSAPGGGPPEKGKKKPPGGNETRQGATREGQANGSDGPPGRSPGPNAPNRPQAAMAGSR